MTVKKACNLQVDYSTVPGERILPFIFTLDTEKSILFPQGDQLQRFCYKIEGKGQDTSQFADLSHFLLGICPDITAEDFGTITVKINGEYKTVIWGQNVEIKTEEHPDNPTGCTGLKFDFGLNKINGIMEVCFELKEAQNIGPINVCAFGGGTTVTGQSICGPICNQQESCNSTFFQTETVCVPVTVRPFAVPGEAKATCCGDPIISNGAVTCPGTQRNECHFTISQKLCIEIPISFGADVETGAAVTQCGEVNESGCNCDTSFITSSLSRIE